MHRWALRCEAHRVPGHFTDVNFLTAGHGTACCCSPCCSDRLSTYISPLKTVAAHARVNHLQPPPFQTQVVVDAKPCQSTRKGCGLTGISRAVLDGVGGSAAQCITHVSLTSRGLQTHSFPGKSHNSTSPRTAKPHVAKAGTQLTLATNPCGAWLAGACRQCHCRHVGCAGSTQKDTMHALTVLACKHANKRLGGPFHAAPAACCNIRAATIVVASQHLALIVQRPLRHARTSQARGIRCASNPLPIILAKPWAACSGRPQANHCADHWCRSGQRQMQHSMTPVTTTTQQHKRLHNTAQTVHSQSMPAGRFPSSSRCRPSNNTHCAPNLILGD